MTSTPKRYPLSTADGKAIPLDTIRPHSFLPLEVLVATGTTSKLIPEDIELFSVISTSDAYISFFANPTVAGALVANTESADTLFVPKGLHIVVSPPLDKPNFSARAISVQGTMYIQFLASWTGLTLQSQINRR